MRLPMTMTRQSVHPATRLIVWIALVIAVQSLGGLALASAFLVLPLCGRPILRRAGRLVWRARWLLASLLLIFAWGVAGEPLWTAIPAPTYEGCGEALTHCGRLLLVLIAVAGLLETMPLADLLAATHLLAKPLRHLGLDPDRAVVRLMLVLRYVEALPRPRDWRVLLDSPPVSRCERVEVDHRTLRRADYLLVLSLIVAATFYGLG